MSLTQSAAYEELRKIYGGSDSTRPSPLRPSYVKYNSIGKARDLGRVESLVKEIQGSLGGEVGSNTYYCKVQLIDSANIQLLLNATGASTDRLLTCTLLDSDKRPISLDARGFGYRNDVHNTDTNESLAKLTPGVYYVSVSSDQWQAIPFSLSLLVVKYIALAGAAGGVALPLGRLPLLKISGAASCAANSTATLRLPGLIKRLEGAAGGSASPSLTLVIMSGVAVGSMLPYGRLQGNWKLTGTASGSAPLSATLTSEAPYGGGY